MLSCPHIIISEYTQTYHTSPSCYYVSDLLCVTISPGKISLHKNIDPLCPPPFCQELEKIFDIVATRQSHIINFSQTLSRHVDYSQTQGQT